MDELQRYQPDEITPNPLNPRGPVSANDSGMEELIASVREKGILQPLTITPQRVIIIGHRRHKAAEICGVALPCLVKDSDLIEQQEIMLIENLQRQDLNPLREGQAYARLQEAGLALSEIARRCGVISIRVSDRIAIANFPADIGDLFAKLELPIGAARPLAKIEDEDALRRIAGMIVTRRLALPAIEKLVKEVVVPRKPHRNYEKKHSERPKGIIRDELVDRLTELQAFSVTYSDLVRELDYVCCACGMNGTEAGRTTLCSACPLAAFLNRFAKLPLKPNTSPHDLMAQTAPIQQ